MKIRRWIGALLACITMLGSIIPPAAAMQQPQESIIWLDDLEWEWIDPSTVECREDGILPRTRVSVDGSYSAHSIYAVTPYVYLQAHNTVTFNCSYSPSSVSMDFGVITSQRQIRFHQWERGQHQLGNRNEPGWKLRGGGQEQIYE